MNCFIIIFLALIALSRQGKLQSTYEQDDKLSADREAQFYCYKLKTCTPDDQKVCGYDPHEPWLAVFADICTMYKANCDKKGRFKLVDQVVCDTRIAYDKEHVNEEFEWIHLSTTTKKPTITTTIDLPQKAPQGKPENTHSMKTLIQLDQALDKYSQLQEKYALYHCHQKKICTPGGDKVCGVDLKTKVVAEFPDKCTLHGVNCNKMGFYWKLDTDHCAATVIFGAELFHLGQPQGYETVSPSPTPANTTKSVFPSWIADRIKKSFASLLNRTHVTQMR